jgi:hypothetical protein
MGPGVRMDPYFMDDQPVQKNITLLTGQTAYFECNVRNLGANKVKLLTFTTLKIKNELAKQSILKYFHCCCHRTI